MALPNTEYLYMKGVLQLVERDADTGVTGKVLYTGNCPELKVAITAEKLEHFESMSGQNRKDRSIVKTLAVDIEATLESISRDVAEILFWSERQTVDADASVVDTLPTGIVAGETYLLSSQNLVPSSAVVTDSTGSPITLNAADYTIDETFGTIKINRLTATGTQQIETAQVAGTIAVSGAGNATVIVTSAGMSGSPITLSVAVANNDTATIVAGKIRSAMIANSVINARFDIGGAGPNITLTRKAAAADDATLNVSIADGTCSGLTSAPTSINTQAGVVASASYTQPFIVTYATSESVSMPLLTQDQPVRFVRFQGTNKGNPGDTKKYLYEFYQAPVEPVTDLSLINDEFGKFTMKASCLSDPNREDDDELGAFGRAVYLTPDA